jgi:hypothetical protein
VALILGIDQLRADGKALATLNEPPHQQGTDAQVAAHRLWVYLFLLVV